MLKAHTEISQLEPKSLWQFFDQICAIPHPSKHEEALASFIVNWAKSKNLAVKRDKTGNVFIKKPAYPGMEYKKSVVLQAHIDMVPQKNSDYEHNFVTDPIKPYIDGQWVTAQNTTLGADNGMGMASCLAVLDSTDIKHGPLEVLLTIDEEAGMTGAFGLEAGWLESDILLNTDSEQEGEIYMGCAGGIDATFTLNVDREAHPNARNILISISGLKGGHSGVDIHTGRANASKLLSRFFHDFANELDIRIIDFNGGTLINAIPREASILVSINQDELPRLEQQINNFKAVLEKELSKVETTFELIITEASEAALPFSRSCHKKLIALINACPNGVLRMSDDIPGVVETSLNIGVITTFDNTVKIECLIRSLIDSGRQNTEGMVLALADLAGVNIDFSGACPGWKPDPDSPILHLFRDVYEGIYNKKPEIMVIHAGLECGLFKKPYPDMDMISFGPTIKFPHSPDEKIEINSVSLYWQQMKAILENIPAK